MFQQFCSSSCCYLLNDFQTQQQQCVVLVPAATLSISVNITNSMFGCRVTAHHHRLLPLPVSTWKSRSLHKWMTPPTTNYEAFNDYMNRSGKKSDQKDIICHTFAICLVPTFPITTLKSDDPSRVVPILNSNQESVRRHALISYFESTNECTVSFKILSIEYDWRKRTSLNLKIRGREVKCELHPVQRNS